MKARLEKIVNADGSVSDIIKIYGTVPNKFKHDNGYVIGGGRALSDDELKSYGFYNVIQPSFDARIQELSNLHLDGDVYTYDVIEKPIKETLAELKSQKIQTVKFEVESKLKSTDWYIIREADNGQATPQSIKDEREALRAKSNSIEAEINALTTKKAVVLFDINL